MLAEVRKALANVIAEGMSQVDAKVEAHPPKALQAGVYVYVQPDPASYLAAWRSFGDNGRCEINYQVVVCVPDNGNPAAAWDQLDELLDPLSSAPNVFGAVRESADLGVPGIEATAAPLIEDVPGPQLTSVADGSVTYYEMALPVRVIAQRS